MKTKLTRKNQTIQVAIPRAAAKDLIDLAKSWRMTPEETAIRIIRQRAARKKLRAAQEIGRKIAKDLGIKTEQDIERLFGDEAK